MARRDPAAGFTFVELLIALAIIAFAFTYGFLHLDGVTGASRLSSSGRQVGTTIEFLRGEAIHEARPFEMVIDLDKHQFWSIRKAVPSEASAAAEGGGAEEDQEDVATDPLDLPRGVRFEGVQVSTSDTVTSGQLTVRFTPLGEITPNGFLIRIVSEEIEDPERQAFSVEVNGLTGEVAYSLGRAVFDQVVDSATMGP